MRKRNSVSQLNRTATHRRAMLKNMATSLFLHERVTTTRAKGKVLKSYAERLITRARWNLADGIKPEEALHNRRELLKHVRDEDVVTKLLTEIAPRFKDRAGGYTRMIHLPERQSDSSQMSIVELVDFKERVRKATPEKATKAKKGDDKGKGKGKAKAAEKEKDSTKDKEGEDKKWYWRFRRKRET